MTAQRRLVLVLPGAATEHQLEVARRMYPGVDVIRSRPIPMATKELPR